LADGWVAFRKGHSDQEDYKECHFAKYRELALGFYLEGLINFKFKWWSNSSRPALPGKMNALSTFRVIRVPRQSQTATQACPEGVSRYQGWNSRENRPSYRQRAHRQRRISGFYHGTMKTKKTEISRTKGNWVVAIAAPV